MLTDPDKLRSASVCLEMLLRHHGRTVRPEDVEHAFHLAREGGRTPQAILTAGSLLGLRGRKVRVELAELRDVEAGAILQIGFSHYVIFEKASPHAAHVIDPTTGRREIPMTELATQFAGTVLVFEAPARFGVPAPKGSTLLWKHIRHAIAASNLWGRIIATTLLLHFFGLGLPLITGRLVDRVVPRNDYHLLGVLLAGLLIIVVAHFFTTIVRSFLLMNLRTQLEAKTSFGLLEHVLRLPYVFFQRRLPADLIMRMNSTAAIREGVTSTVLSSVIDGSLVLSYLVILITISPKMAALASLIVFAKAALFAVTRSTIVELSAGTLTKQTELGNYLNDAFGGMETVKLAGAEDRVVQGWASLYVDLLNLNLRKAGVVAWSESLLGTVRLLSPIGLLLVGVIQVMNGDFTLGVMLSAQAFATGFIGPMANLIESFNKLQMLGGIFARLEDVLSAEPEQKNANARLAPPLHGGIELKALTFTYAPRALSVIKGVNLKILPGKHVAVVGPSGSGKSTLVSLLLGLYPPTSGDLLFDGIRLWDLDIRSVRRQVGVVPQTPKMFGKTIRGNIALADPSMAIERLHAAARAACIHDEIMKLPLGYETPVLASGASLSAGQRQRIALARALVSKPAILILDEATSSLDADMEARIYEELDKLQVTRIVVTHRMSSAARAELVVAMDHGATPEIGTHDQLLAKKGHYARLWDAQMALYRPSGGAAAGHAEPMPPSSPEADGGSPASWRTFLGANGQLPPPPEVVAAMTAAGMAPPPQHAATAPSHVPAQRSTERLIAVAADASAAPQPSVPAGPPKLGAFHDDDVPEPTIVAKPGSPAWTNAVTPQRPSAAPGRVPLEPTIVGLDVDELRRRHAARKK